MLVVHKPAGLLSVPGRGPERADCVAARLQAEWPQARVVHRLDMATSGLMVFALGLDAQRHLSRSFEQRRVHKTYEAIVWGRPTSERGSIDLPLICDWPQRPRQKVDFEAGRPALTHWEKLVRRGARRLRHQPPAADAGDGPVPPAAGAPVEHRPRHRRGRTVCPTPAPRLWRNRLYLHACRLSLPHPQDDRSISFEVPTPF
jgi:tRNA pseudouridine32 synthase/23S rRNA pseudouridine746 synthase